MFGSSTFGSVPFGGEAPAAGTATVSADLAADYTIAALVASDLAGSYTVAGLVSADLAAVYAIGALVHADLAGSYAILSNVTYARAPAGDGYRPRCTARHSRPPAIQGNYR